MMSQPYDYLIAFEAITAPVSNGSTQRNFLTTNSVQMKDDQPKIIHIYWASYDVKRKIVVSEWEYFIKHDTFTGLSSETIDETKVTNEDIQQKGVSLKDAIQHFNEAIYRNYIHNNLSFCLVTEDDEVLTRILPSDARETGIKLTNHFFQYFDLREEFKILYRLPGTFETLGDYLAILKLKETVANSLCQAEVKNMLTLIDRLIRDGHIFQSPKCLNTQHQIISEKTETTPYVFQPPTQTPIQPNAQWSSFPQDVQSQDYEESTRLWFIRMRGIPYSAREQEVLNFLKGTQVSLEDIVLGYGSDGRFSGDAYVRLKSDEDFKSTLSLNLSNMGSRYIEIFETSENDFNRTKAPPHFPNKPKYNQGGDAAWSHLLNENFGVLRMRGLPYSSSDSDILSFFNGYNVVKDGVKRGMTGGRPSGECYVVFNSKEEAHRAMGKNMERIGSRFIELFTASPRELEIFLYQNFGNNNNSSHSRVNISNIHPDKRKSTLMMVGLPFNVSKFDVLKFFDDFDLKEYDINLISNKGRFSGNASITFSDEREAQRALKTKNLSFIGNRYVELYEYR